MIARRVLLLLCAMISIRVFAAEDASIMVRTRLEPATVAVGQSATLYVATYTPLFFTSGIELPALAVPGAIVKLSDARPSHVSTQVGDTSWTGIEHRYRITPIVAADLTIPAFEVAAKVGPQMQRSSTRATGRTLKVSVPAGAEGAFLTHDLSVDQRIDVDPATLKVGDALTRTVILRAKGTPAMFIPDVTFTPVSGLKAYLKAPQLTDSSPDGPVEGARTFSVTYVVQQVGEFELPEIQVRWWDLDSSEIKTASAPAVQVHSIAAPADSAAVSVPTEPAVAEPERRVDWRRVLAIGALLIVAVLLAVLLRPYVANAWRAWQRARKRRRAEYLESEPFAFRELERATQSGSREQMMTALYHWLDRLPGATEGQTAATTQLLADQATCTELLQECYGRSAQTGRLHWHLRSMRRKALRGGSSARTVDPLPALNP